MTTWLLVAGFVLLAIAAFFLWSWWGDRKSIALMRATGTTRAADIAKLPPGTQVEVKGILRCAAPVTGEFSQCACAYFAAAIEREYTRYDYDHQNKRPKRVRGKETIQNRIHFAPFEVEDESGSVAVRPEQASIEGVVAVQRFEPHVENHTGEGFAAAALRNLTTNEETVGYHYQETHLPLDSAVYILGVTTADGAIGAPADGAKHQHFVVSTKSEEERMRDLTKSAGWTMALGLGGALLAIAAFSGAYYVSRPASPEVPPQATDPAQQEPAPASQAP